MKKYRSHVAGIVALVVAVVGTAEVNLRGTQPEGEVFRYHRVYSDENGVSHFEDATMTFEMQETVGDGEVRVVGPGDVQARSSLVRRSSPSRRRSSSSRRTRSGDT